MSNNNNNIINDNEGPPTIPTSTFGDLGLATPEISPALVAQDQLSPPNDGMRLSVASMSLPKHFAPKPPRKLPSNDSIVSGNSSNEQMPIYKSDLDVRSSYESRKWRYKSDTCSLSSRNSDADDEDDSDSFNSEKKKSNSFLSSTSLPLTPFKNQVCKLLFLALFMEQN
jgi:hypothetical protein